MKGKHMLIPTYELEVFTPPCDPGAERFSTVAHLPVDIRDALPYLNATLRGAVYTEPAHSLTWKKAGHNVAFHADRDRGPQRRRPARRPSRSWTAW